MAESHSASLDYFFDRDESEVFGDHASKISLFSVTLDDIITDFAISEYENQVLIIITQFQKIGTLLTVSKGSVKNLNGCEDIYDVRTLCGLDSQDCQLAARFLSSQINTMKPIIFGISLKDYRPQILKAIAKVLSEYI